jgi:hypothetical protein
MALLGKLGIVQRCIRRFEIGAAVLLVGVEKERIEAAVEVVVPGHVVLRPAARIELLDVADQVAEPPLQLGPARRHVRLIERHGQHVGDRSPFDHQRAIGIDLAECKLGIEQHAPLRGPGQESHRDRLAGTIAKGKTSPAGGRDDHRTASNESAQEEFYQSVHRAPNDRISL